MDKYSKNHENKENLLIHIIAVPTFIFSNIILLYGFFLQNMFLIIGCIFAILLSLGIQGKGHKLEVNKPDKFINTLDIIKRIYIEQFISFPKFVLSGNFYKNFSK